ncbi:MAG: M60 family metallopeptidase [Thermoguttaceae bacterium]
MKRSAALVVTLFITAIVVIANSFGATPNTTASDDRAAILKDVETLACIGTPGPLVVFSPQCFPLLVGSEDKIIAAAGRYKNGRIVVFGHNGYLDNRSDVNATFYKNLIAWVAARNNDEKIRIAVHRNAKLAEAMNGLGYVAFSFDDWEKLSWPEIDIVWAETWNIPEKSFAPLTDFIARGGGFVTGVTAWARNFNAELPWNRLVASMGICFTGDYLGATRDGMFETATSISPLLHVNDAFKALIADDSGKQKLADGDSQIVSTTLMRGLRSMPLKEQAPFAKWAESRPVPVITEKTPLRVADAGQRFLVAQKLARYQAGEGDPKKLGADPSAAAFPGLPADNAKKIKKTVRIDTSVPDWHSLGLYAAPGDVVTVRIPDSAAASKKRLAVVIGCHQDQIWDHKEWKRPPQIMTRRELAQPVTQVCNPFGGIFYIDVPRGCDLGSVEVSIENILDSPLFILGKTTPEEWKKQRDAIVAPWGEIASNKIIISLPTSVLAKVDDPAAVMEFWNNVADACADLCGRQRERDRPERLVPDVQISAGYMHSGYPIMTHMDVVDHFTDVTGVKGVKRDGWGFFHEIGHNHQSGDWTFGGTGEVTVNLFTLYVYDTVCGVTPEKTRRELTSDWQSKAIAKYIAEGKSFEKWKNDPFLALAMYDQLRAKYGWDAFRKTFAAYREIPNGERPKNDDEKRDQWLVRFSRTVGEDLSDFFEAWGVPTSSAARTSLQDLPKTSLKMEM